MAHADEWFHEQLTRLRPPPTRARAAPPTPPRSGRTTVLASVALLAVIGLFVMEAMGGPLRADQPFGFSAPPAVSRASSMPSVNGHGPAAPVEDRNKIVLSGTGSGH